LRFDWDDANVRHIGRHKVTVAEVEQAFDATLLHGAAEVRGSEMRVSFLAPTHVGRLLAVTFTVRGSLIRVVTARDASRKERKLYGEYEKGA
jgi:uncharacterized protein